MSCSCCIAGTLNNLEEVSEAAQRRLSFLRTLQPSRSSGERSSACPKTAPPVRPAQQEEKRPPVREDAEEVVARAATNRGERSLATIVAIPRLRALPNPHPPAPAVPASTLRCCGGRKARTAPAWFSSTSAPRSCWATSLCVVRRRWTFAIRA